MTKNQEYQSILRNLPSWDEYLLQESGLPGPRGNIELAQVVAEEGDLALFQRYLRFTPDLAPVNSPYEFLAFCGVLGLGRLVAEGDWQFLPVLQQAASDPRWRTREAVAMALQRWGDLDISALIEEMQIWCHGSALEQRAAAAAICEPRLLKQHEIAESVFEILDTIMQSISQTENRRREDFIALRKGLGYCWSVAVVAFPDLGMARMEKWIFGQDKDIRWILRENLKKNRLIRMDPAWVTSLLNQIE
jgi:hypothetical protein